MPEATYSVEHSKSSRSKCKRCKEAIAKGDVRMCVFVPKSSEGSFDLSSYYHVECFRLPRKFTTGSTKLSPQKFLEDYVEDKSEEQGLLFPHERLERMAAKIEAASEKGGPGSAAKKKRKSADDDDDAAAAAATLMGRIKAAADGDEEKTPAKKKSKNGDSNDDVFEKYLTTYKMYHKIKADSLKDILRWNKQLLTGHKDWLLFKIIDGETHGRLGMCGLCGGRLKFQEGDEDHVFCTGRFDEDNQVRQPCGFQGDRTDDTKVTRYHPWYSQEPSEEEKEEMEKIIEAARDENGGSGGGQGKGGMETRDGKEMLKQAADFDWKLSSKEGIKKATADLVALVKEHNVDLPAGKNPKMVVGPMIVSNLDKSPQDIVKLVIEKYGFANIKEEKKAAKEAAMESMCENPKNAGLLMAFQELAQLYFKDGNRNAGASYTKVVNAVKGLELEITADNAMSLSKGKTKVAGIGKASAEKMKEFCETGTMEKLEEKRAAHA